MDPAVSQYEAEVSALMEPLDPEAKAVELADRLKRETNKIMHLPPAHVAYALITNTMCCIASLKCSRLISPELADALAGDLFDTIVRRSSPGTPGLTAAIRQS